MSFSSLNATRRKNEELRRTARMWRDIDEYANQPSPPKFTHTRRPLKIVGNKRRDGPWDEEGCLTERAKDTDALAKTNNETTPKPRRRAASVGRETRKQAIMRLSSVKKPKPEKKEKKYFESDFEGFLKRQTESGKARMEAEKKYRISTRPAMSQGSKAILKKARRNSTQLSEPSSARRERSEQQMETPRRTVKDTSRRLMTLNVEADVERVQAKKKILAEALMEENRDVFTYKPNCNKEIPATSKVKKEDRPKIRISEERKQIEAKRIEVKPIIEEAEAEHWVKPEYGKVPHFIREIAETCPADHKDDVRRSQRERSDKKRRRYV